MKAPLSLVDVPPVLVGAPVVEVVGEVDVVEAVVDAVVEAVAGSPVVVLPVVLAGAGSLQATTETSSAAWKGANDAWNLIAVSSRVEGESARASARRPRARLTLNAPLPGYELDFMHDLRDRLHAGVLQQPSDAISDAATAPAGDGRQSAHSIDLAISGARGSVAPLLFALH